MKLLMVNKFLYPAGGAETYLFQVGNYWKEKGAQVEYFGMEHPGNVVGNRWGLYAKAVDFHRTGIKANAVNPLRLIRSRDAARKIAAILREFQPQVLHLNNFNYQLTPSILEAAQDYRRESGRRLRIVYTAHDPQLVCPNHYLYDPGSRQVCERCLEGSYLACVRTRCVHGSLPRSCLGAAEAAYWRKRRIYRVIDTILCPSQFMKQALDTDPLLASRTVVLRNFVRPVRKTAKEKGAYVLYFGRYSEEKGIKTLADACRALPHIPFVFAGSGPLERRIAGMANVRNVGFLKGEALDQVIRGARFSVCPSECNENCPFSVMESIRNGTPVLGARRGGIPELIREGETGWLFPAADGEALTERIGRLWDSDEPEQMTEACQRESFDTLEEYGEKLREIYGLEPV